MKNPIKPINKSGIKKCKGVSLIELMIAMSLGLLVSGAAIKIVISAKQSYFMVEELNEIQENGQFSTLFLTKAIQMAGYSDPDDGALPNLFLAEGECNVTDSFCTSDGSPGSSDRLSVQLNPDTDKDCTGTDIPEASMLANVYYLDTANGISGLYCRGYDPLNAEWYSDAVLLVNGIDGLQFQFGTIESSEYQFLSAEKISDWKSIQSVRFALLSTSKENDSLNEKSRRYALLDAEELEYKDSKIRRIFSTTVYVNNSFL